MLTPAHPPHLRLLKLLDGRAFALGPSHAVLRCCEDCDGRGLVTPAERPEHPGWACPWCDGRGFFLRWGEESTT